MRPSTALNDKSQPYPRVKYWHEVEAVHREAETLTDMDAYLGFDKLKMITFSNVTGEGQSAGFKPRAGDAFICTPPKCGTTMMCQV